MDIHSKEQEEEIQEGIVDSTEPKESTETKDSTEPKDSTEYKDSIEYKNSTESNDSVEEKLEPNNTDKKDEPTNYIKEIRDIIVYLAIVFLIVLFVKHYVGEQVRVEGRSMESTLHNYERLILEKLSYRFGEPERFDIIVFQPYPDNDKELYIKRIIGLPGDKVQIIGNDIYINDKMIEENYGKEDTINDPGIAQDSIQLADDEYFVMGDNRNNSTDSRVIGPIKKSSIIGRAWVRIWPFNKMSVLEHQ